MQEVTAMKKISFQMIAILLASAMLLASVSALFAQPILRNDIIVDAPQEDDPLPPEPPQSDGETNAPQEEPEDVPEENIPQPPQTPATANYIKAKVNGLNLRSGPGSGYSSVGYIDAGDMVALITKEGAWYKTKYKNKTAYISASELYTEEYSMAKASQDVIEEVIGEGLLLLGHPYIYGAIRFHDGAGNKLKNFDPTKYDCSSLMQYIFYHGAGINLNMTTRTQVKQGTYVAKSDLRRGDLMFFTNSTRYNKTGTERIGHVALYLGDNYILHTASDYAVIEPISAQRWKYYIESRRFF